MQTGDSRVRRGLVRLLRGAAFASIFTLTGAAQAEEPRVGEGQFSSPAPRAGGSCSANASLFGPGNWPPACWRPYGAKSPFNRSLGANPKIARRSHRMVRGTLRSKEIQSLIAGHPHRSPNDYGHPVYYADSNDPVYTVRCVQWVDSCEVHGMRVRIPSSAVPAGGTDAHMTVVNAASDWEYDFWDVRTTTLSPLGGTIQIGHGGRTRWGVRGATGLGSNATAAHFGLSGGVIRAEEWEGATLRNGPIRHALFATVSCTNGHAVYPAARGTSGTVCSHRRKTAPPLGTRYQLDMSFAQIDALGAPAWKSSILKTLARYGMIVGDTGGGGGNAFGLMAESDTQYTALGYPGRFAALGTAWGVPQYGGAYVFDFASGVRWLKRLRVVRPCVSSGAC